MHAKTKNSKNAVELPVTPPDRSSSSGPRSKTTVTKGPGDGLKEFAKQQMDALTQKPQEGKP